MLLLPRSACLLVALLPFGAMAAQADSLTAWTDRADYRPLDTVAVTFVNAADSTMYLASDGCRTLDDKPLPQVVIERLGEAEEWTAYVQGRLCGDAEHPPAVLWPGEPYRVQFQVGLLGPLPLGTYRYRFFLLADPSRSEATVPGGEVTSNVFRVRV